MVNRAQFEDAGGFRLDWYALLLAAATVAGGALVLARGFGYGIGLEWDSVAHLAAARGLLAGDGFAGFGGLPYDSFPPLYPLLLAAASLGVFDPHSIAGPLNAILFALTIAIAGIYLRTRLQSGLLAAAGILALMLSIPLASAAAWALPTPAFILFVTLALIQTDRFLTAGRIPTLLAAAACTALAILTNQLGFAVLATVALLLILQGDTPAADKAKRIGSYALISLIPLALWLLWNSLSGGDTAADGGGASGSFSAARAAIPATLFGWVIPDLPGISLASMGLGTVMIVLGALGLLLAILLCLFAIAYDYGGRSDGDYYDAGAPRPGYVFGGFALVYLIALLITSIMGGPDGGFQARLLAPLYLPLLLLALLLADVFLSRRQEQGIAGAVSAPLMVLAAALGIWLALLAVSNGRAIVAANQGDPAELGYAAAGWADSPLPAYLAQTPAGSTLLTNNLAAAYIYQETDRDLELRPLPCNPAELETALLTANDTGPVAAAWFPDRSDRGCAAADNAASAYRFAELLTTPGLEPTALLGYGVAFAFDSSDAGNADLYRQYPAHDAETGVALDSTDGAFEVYVGARNISYLRETCAADDTAAPFYLQITPHDPSVLPANPRAAGSETRDFRFADRGAMFNGQCLAFAPLPDYGISEIQTGQSAGRTWAVTATLYRGQYAYVLDSGDPMIQADFDVYRLDDRLVYLRESCAAADTDADFFLRLLPADAAVLPDDQREASFQNRDFTFDQAGGGQFDDKCLASVMAPGYTLGAIRTGQLAAGDNPRWEAELYTDAYFDALRARYAELTDGEPLASAAFIVYRRPDAMIYALSECAGADTESHFFLHLFPDDAADLSADRRQYGFENRDFNFEQLDILRIDGKCLVSAALPDYPLAALRTGQYIPGQDRIWEVSTLSEDDAMPGSDGGTAAAATAAAGTTTTTTATTTTTTGTTGTATTPTAPMTPDVPTLRQPTGLAAAPPAVDLPALRDKYAALDTAELLAQGDFNLYLGSGELIYAREQCTAADTAATFFLHLIPATVSDLPAERQAHRYENLLFEFDLEGGGVFDGHCLVAVPLPNYTVIGIRTGQLDAGGESQQWSVTPWLGYALLGNPIARGDYDVYFQAGRLYYHEVLCTTASTTASFFLHIYPADLNDLPRSAHESGVEFENRDFAFDDNGTRLGRQCITAAALPDYPISKIRTGQHIPDEGVLWTQEFTLPDLTIP